MRGGNMADWKKRMGTMLVLLLCWRAEWLGGSAAVVFTFTNRCGYTVWPGMLSSAGIAAISDGGFELGAGDSALIRAPAGWSGRLWGRTGCNFTGAGVGHCASGDCGGRLACAGAGAEPPATLAEFTLKGSLATQDFYDVSLVDGFNLPLSVSPSNRSCGTAGCPADINPSCPSELQVLGESNQVIACKSACLAFQSAEYCCSGTYASPSTCKPSNYAKIFKKYCPNAYSYAYDDPSSIFTCTGANYDITFCPPSSNLQLCCPHSKHGHGSSTSTSTMTRRPPLVCALLGGLFLLFPFQKGIGASID